MRCTSVWHSNSSHSLHSYLMWIGNFCAVKALCWGTENAECSWHCLSCLEVVLLFKSVPSASFCINAPNTRHLVIWRQLCQKSFIYSPISFTTARWLLQWWCGSNAYIIVQGYPFAYKIASTIGSASKMQVKKSLVSLKADCQASESSLWLTTSAFLVSGLAVLRGHRPYITASGVQ